MIVHTAHPLVEANMGVVRAETLKTPGAPVHAEYAYLVQNVITNMHTVWHGVPASDRLDFSKLWTPRAKIALLYNRLLDNSLVPPVVSIEEHRGAPLPWSWVLSLEGHPCGPLVLRVDTAATLMTFFEDTRKSVSLWRGGIMYARACSPTELATNLLHTQRLRPDAFLYLEHYLRLVSSFFGSWSDGARDMAVLGAMPSCPPRLRVFCQLLEMFHRPLTRPSPTAAEVAAAHAARKHWFATTFRTALASGWYAGQYADSVLDAVLCTRHLDLVQVALLLAAGLDPDIVSPRLRDFFPGLAVTQLSLLCGARRLLLSDGVQSWPTNGGYEAWPLVWPSRKVASIQRVADARRAWSPARRVWAMYM
jgi:hypothetical protein